MTILILKRAMTPLGGALVLCLAASPVIAGQANVTEHSRQSWQQQTPSTARPGENRGGTTYKRDIGKRQTKYDAPSTIRPLDRVASRVENRIRNRLENRIGSGNDAIQTTTSAFEDADYRSRRARATPR